MNIVRKIEVVVMPKDDKHYFKVGTDYRGIVVTVGWNGSWQRDTPLKSDMAVTVEELKEIRSAIDEFLRLTEK